MQLEFLIKTSNYSVVLGLMDPRGVTTGEPAKPMGSPKLQKKCPLWYTTFLENYATYVRICKWYCGLTKEKVMVTPLLSDYLFTYESLQCLGLGWLRLAISAKDRKKSSRRWTPFSKLTTYYTSWQSSTFTFWDELGSKPRGAGPSKHHSAHKLLLK